MVNSLATPGTNQSKLDRQDITKREQLFIEIVGPKKGRGVSFVQTDGPEARLPADQQLSLEDREGLADPPPWTPRPEEQEKVA